MIENYRRLATRGAADDRRDIRRPTQATPARAFAPLSPLIAPPDIQHERESHDGDYRTVEAHGSERRTGRRIRQFGESRRHSHARGTCRLCVRSALTKKFAQPGLKVPDSWIYEKTRGRCRYLSGSSALAARRGTGLIPFLHLGRYVRLQRPLPYVCQRNAIPCVSPSVGTFHKG